MPGETENQNDSSELTAAPGKPTKTAKPKSTAKRPKVKIEVPEKLQEVLKSEPQVQILPGMAHVLYDEDTNRAIQKSREWLIENGMENYLEPSISVDPEPVPKFEIRPKIRKRKSSKSKQSRQSRQTRKRPGGRKPTQEVIDPTTTAGRAIAPLVIRQDLVWEQPPIDQWVPAVWEMQMWERWSMGGTFLKITLDASVNPRGFPLMEVTKIILAVNAYCQKYLTKNLESLKQRHVTTYEMIIEELMIQYEESKRPKRETITTPDGKVTTKVTERSADVGILKLCTGMMSELRSLMSEVTKSADSENALPSVMGRNREEWRAEVSRRLIERLMPIAKVKELPLQTQ